MDNSTHSGREDVPTNEDLRIQSSEDRAGLIELPAGASVEAILEVIGGIPEAKAIQIDRPYGAIIPTSLGHLLPDYKPPEPDGGIVGPRALVILTNKQCIVDTVLHSVNSFLAKSRGTCTQCRDGLQQGAAILKGISSGQGRESDLEQLQEIALSIAGACLCGFGRAIAGPLLSSLRYFRAEYQEHVDGHCYALVCRPLLHVEIIQSKCHGERCCLPCPSNAIQGSFGKPGWIVEELCAKCRICATRCPYGAVRVYS